MSETPIVTRSRIILPGFQSLRSSTCYIFHTLSLVTSKRPGYCYVFLLSVIYLSYMLNLATLRV